MGTELLMPLYKQWGVTHYIFNVIVLTSLEKSFSRLHHRIFIYIYIYIFVGVYRAICPFWKLFLHNFWQVCL